MKNARLLLLALLYASSLLFCDAEELSQRVGQPLVIAEKYLPGPLLEALPRRNREPSLVVRILETKPAQDGYRYTFEVQGLDPGTHNLGDYLREANTEQGASGHQLPIKITTALPLGLVQPTPLSSQETPRIGGYRALLWLLGLLWFAGLVGIFFWKRKKEVPPVAKEAALSIADRLAPLLTKASRDELETEDRAQLERLVVGHWRKELPEIADLEPAAAIIALRQHPEASPLLAQLERWLHAPATQFSSAEIDALLEPYRP